MVDESKPNVIKVTGNGAPLRRSRKPEEEDAVLIDSTPILDRWVPEPTIFEKRSLTYQAHVGERNERIRDMYKSGEQALVNRISRQFRLPTATVREIIVPEEPTKCRESDATTES